MNGSYGIWMIAGALICAAVYGLLARGLKRPALCWVSLGLSAVLGTVCAKLVYYLAQIDFMIANGWLASLVNTDPAQWCFFGGGIGVVLGVWLAAKWMRVSPAQALDAFAPAGALMAAIARFGAWFLQDAMIGLGEYLEDPALCFFPLAVRNEWDEYYLAVFMLEGLFALIVTVLALCRFRKMRFVRTVFWLCLGQIFLESLHSDSISWLFVRVEQLLSMLTVAAVLILYTLRMGPRPRRWLPLAICLMCAGLFVGVEFALDKTSWPIPLIYGAMGLGLAVLAVTEARTFRVLKIND